MFSFAHLLFIIALLAAAVTAQYDSDGVEFVNPYVKKARPQGPMRFGKRRAGPSGPMRFGKRSAMVPLDQYYDSAAVADSY